VEDFWGSGKKGVGRISVKRMNLAPGENDLGSQGRLSWRKLDKRLRDPSLEAHVQFDATLSTRTLNSQTLIVESHFSLAGFSKAFAIRGVIF
jgi:hypothetical protein